MTTIAVKDGVMACDSQVTTGWMRSNLKFDKVMKWKGAYYGFCGDCHYINIAKEYIKGELKLENLPTDMKVDYLKLDSDGSAYKYTIKGGKESYMECGEFCAIGSGAEYAIVALSCGKSAVEAVKEACKWDVFSGGKIKSYSVGGKV